MRKPELISYKGKTISYMDFSNLKTIDEIDSLIKLSKAYIHNQTTFSVLALTNIDGIHFNSNIKGMFSDFVGSNKPFVKASAVIGISGLVRIVYNAVTRLNGRDVRSFDTDILAKEWLASK